MTGPKGHYVRKVQAQRTNTFKRDRPEGPLRSERTNPMHTVVLLWAESERAETIGPNAVWAENGRNHLKWTSTRARSFRLIF
jgi:hypothetical protein